jgi:DNA replication protein DnaC
VTHLANAISRSAPNAKAGWRLSSSAPSLIPLIVVDEVGYIPFDAEAANLIFSLVSNRYERASR